MIDKSSAHGVKYNVCLVGQPEEEAKFLEMGIDSIFTNDYLFAFYGTNGKRKTESGVFRVFIGEKSDVEEYREFNLL